MIVKVLHGPPGPGLVDYALQNAAPPDLVIDVTRLCAAVTGLDGLDVDAPAREVARAAGRGAFAAVMDAMRGSGPLAQKGGTAWVTRPFLPDDDVVASWEADGVEIVRVDPGEEAALAAVATWPPHWARLVWCWYHKGETVQQVDAALSGGQKARSVARVKAAELQQQSDGKFVGYAAVFGNVDSYGEVVMPGAFAESLAEYGPRGAGIPVLWGHRMDDPMMNLGATVSAVEDEHGLRVEAQLDMDNPYAVQADRLIKAGRVTQMSFAFDVLDAREAARGNQPVVELTRVRLHEVSIVHVGANQETGFLPGGQGGAVEDRPVEDRPVEAHVVGKASGKTAGKASARVLIAAALAGAWQAPLEEGTPNNATREGVMS